MPKQTSREFALERRKALSEGGKESISLNGSSPNRVRTASDAHVTRTQASFVKRKKNESMEHVVNSTYSTPTTASKSSMSVASRRVKPVSHPSRELVLARRDELSRRGKSAAKSKDRTRVDVERKSSEVATSSVTTKYCCDECKENDIKTTNSQNSSPVLPRTTELTTKGVGRRTTTKRKAIQNSSRALVLARREAQSKHGKSASNQPTSAASLARQGNPDLTSRELSQRVRELRSKSGASGSKRSGTTRPCGPNKNGAKQIVNADAHWKVGVSETISGQIVTGTQANRSTKTTGNEASTCRSVTGTQYLGSEVFESFCQSNPVISQPSKVAVTNTTHGNRVTGNEVGRSERVTGNEPGTCKVLTGTEYISANQSTEYCGGSNPSPRKVGQSLTLDGRKVSGAIVGRSSKVTGDEAGSKKGLTGDQYLGTEPIPEGRPAEKVGSFNTLRGSGVTGTTVSRSELVTGNEHGSCKNVTGDEYVGTDQYQSFCGAKPNPEAAKVGLTLTNKSQTVSGTMTGRSALVTGDEPGTCKTVTGTPYAGIDQTNQWCNSHSVEDMQSRTPRRLGTPGPGMTGLQPGVGGVMTGSDKGACETLTGTPYVGADQLLQACGSKAPSGSNEIINTSKDEAWHSFSVQSPSRSTQLVRDKNSDVTGTSYENGSEITGPFNMATNKVTGTEEFRFDRKQREKVAHIENSNEQSQEDSRPNSRVTGEGQSSGLNITGDDWARGDRVTGTEGASARRRNPTRPGSMNAMPSNDQKRNNEIADPAFLITGSSGNTRDGQLVTFSGGARG